VHDFECIWSRAYDRLKYEKRERELLGHVPVIQDEMLRGTSSWGNTFLGKDHHGRVHHLPVVGQLDARSQDISVTKNAFHRDIPKDPITMSASKETIRS
jgi:hypothetical protein